MFFSFFEIFTLVLSDYFPHGGSALLESQWFSSEMLCFSKIGAKGTKSLQKESFIFLYELWQDFSLVYVEPYQLPNQIESEVNLYNCFSFSH